MEPLPFLRSPAGVEVDMRLGHYLFWLALAAMHQGASAEVYEIGPSGQMVETTNRIADETMPQMSAARAESSQSSSPLQASGRNPYRQMIAQTAERYGLSHDLLDAVAWQESRYRANSRSAVGAVGLMQLMPATARSLGVTDATDPAQNLAGGAAYLRIQLNRFDNDLERALAAYNAGPGAVTKYGGIPPYRETQNYVRSILGRLAQASLNMSK
jgi:soluble lytic murein transglycosylase-like protein